MKWLSNLFGSNEDETFAPIALDEEQTQRFVDALATLKEERYTLATYLPADHLMNNPSCRCAACTYQEDHP